MAANLLKSPQIVTGKRSTAVKNYRIRGCFSFSRNRLGAFFNVSVRSRDHQNIQGADPIYPFYRSTFSDKIHRSLAAFDGPVQHRADLKDSRLSP
jgi:hypothetical protein